MQAPQRLAQLLRACVRSVRRNGPLIKAVQGAGATSLRAIAEALNAQNIPTARGAGNWTATQVARVLDHI